MNFQSAFHCNSRFTKLVLALIATYVNVGFPRSGNQKNLMTVCLFFGLTYDQCKIDLMLSLAALALTLVFLKRSRNVATMPCF